MPRNTKNPALARPSVASSGGGSRGAPRTKWRGEGFKKLGAAIFTATVLAGTGFYTYQKLKVVDPYEKVYKIADGDTIILEANKQTVRLYDIDAPETGLCGSTASAKRLTELLKKGKVQLKEPVVDGYRRVLALVYVDGQLINEIMLKEGLVSYLGKPNGEKDKLLAAHYYAVNNKIGIYSKCVDESPPDPKCVIKGNHDLDRDEYVYLLPTCPYYSQVIVRRFEGDAWFCDEKSALKAGFKISPACALGTSRTNSN